jgi:hypothetical protein
MAGPITWRNVTGPSLADASRPLDSAARLIDNAFSNVGNVLEKQTQTGMDNWDQVKENNTQDFLNKIYSAQGAEGFKALQDSGELDRMLAANGAQIDRAAARSAMDGRLTTLQNRDRQGWEYDNAALDQREAPVVDQIKGLIAQGKLEEAKPLIGGLSTRNQAGMFTSLDARTQLELSRDRDAQRFGWDKATAEFQEQTRPEELKSLQLGNTGKELQNQNTKLSNAALRADALERKQTSELQGAVAEAALTYQAERNRIGDAMGSIARANNLPVNALGQPDFASYTNAQLDQFDQVAAQTKARYPGISINIPKARDFVGGDTAAGNRFFQSLVDSKKYKPAVITKFKDSILSSFSSVGDSTLVGNDAANQALANAQQRVVLNEETQNNWFTPGNASARSSYEDLANNVPNLIDKTSGFGVEEDVAPLQNLVFEMATRGIEVKGADGKKKFVSPPANVIRAAIRQAEGGWFSDAKRADNARKYIQDYVNTPEVQKQAAKAEDNAVLLRRQQVQDILKPGAGTGANNKSK